MMEHNFIPVRTRRDLAPIREVLGDLQEGDVVTAAFSTRAYGNFTITGPVRHTLSQDTWVLGSWLLNTGGKGEPVKDLRMLEFVARPEGEIYLPRVGVEDLGQGADDVVGAL